MFQILPIYLLISYCMNRNRSQGQRDWRRKQAALGQQSLASPLPLCFTVEPLMFFSPYQFEQLALAI